MPGTTALVEDVRLLGATINGNVLTVRVSGPVSNGSVFEIKEGALSMEDGLPVEPATITLNNPDPDVFITPTDAYAFGRTLPTNADVLSQAVYPDSADPVILPPRSEGEAGEAEVFADLSAFFDSAVSLNYINQTTADTTLALFNDPDARLVTTDADGNFEPELLAAVLSSAVLGEPGQQSIEAILFGDNPTDQPASVVYGPIGVSGALGQASISPEGVYTITINSSFSDSFSLESERFFTIAPTVFHESFHQDTNVDLPEETVANTADIIFWQDILGIIGADNPSLNTPAGRFNTFEYVVFRQSGPNFAQSGIGPEIGIENAIPDVVDPPTGEVISSSFVFPSSLALINDINSTEGPEATGGNDVSSAIFAEVTGSSFEEGVSVPFDDAYVDALTVNLGTLSTSEDLIRADNTVGFIPVFDVLNSDSSPFARPNIADHPSLDLIG